MRARAEIAVAFAHCWSAMTMTAHPALVLNADFRPMSYFPLSLLSWQDAISAVFSQRVSVVAEFAEARKRPSYLKAYNGLKEEFALAGTRAKARKQEAEKSRTGREVVRNTHHGLSLDSFSLIARSGRRK
jgi:hypothetical protein